MEITTVGIDLAKNVFQVHAIGGAGEVIARQSAKAGSGGVLHPQACALPDRYGGLRNEPSLGARAGRSGSYSAADASGLRQAIREAGQDRRH